MKRKIGTILLALSIATISLTACGKKTDTVETNADTVETKTDTVETKTDTVETNADTVGTNTDAVGTSTGADGSNVKTDVVTQLEESTTNADGSVENAKRTESIAEIQKTLKEKGYDLTAEDIQYILHHGKDPINDIGYVEDYEADKIAKENGYATIIDWAMSQGADTAFGWTFIYMHGEGAGDQRSYGVYMKEGSPLYGKVFHVGEELPTGTPMPGTQEENTYAQAEQMIKTAEERGDTVEYRDGKVIIHID